MVQSAQMLFHICHDVVVEDDVVVENETLLKQQKKV